MNQLLKNDSDWEQLRQKGFLLVDIGLPDAINNIENYVSQHFTLPDTGFYYSLISNNFDQNKALQTFIQNNLSPFYEKQFQNYRTITESFLAKPAHTSQELFLHQDWCYTDESTHNAYNIWIPLTDVDNTNGAIFFLPSSHRSFKNYRSGTYPTARISLSEINGNVETVSMKRGQALLFHPAVFHGSFPNNSGKHRIVITSTVMDKDAPFLYYWKESETQTHVFGLDDETFLFDLERMAFSGIPQGKVIQHLPYVHSVPTATDLMVPQQLLKTSSTILGRFWKSLGIRRK